MNPRFDNSNINLNDPDLLEQMDAQFVNEQNLPTNPDGTVAPGFVYDPYRNQNEEVNLVDTGSVLNSVQTLLEYMCTDEMRELKEKSPLEYEEHLEQKFESFCNGHYKLFKLILDGEDISPLMGMLAQIEKVKRGELTFEEANAQVLSGLATKYNVPTE